MADPRMIDSEPVPFFSGCEGMAEYYGQFSNDQVQFSKRTSLFGGRAYSAFLESGGLPMRVTCACGLGTLGMGILSLKSNMASDRSIRISFRKSSAHVDQRTGLMSAKSVLGFKEYEIGLPTPSSHG